MNLNHHVVYRYLRLGPLHQLHPGRSRSLVRHNDCLHDNFLLRSFVSLVSGKPAMITKVNPLVTMDRAPSS
jgi:hypothetical protein